MVKTSCTNNIRNAVPAALYFTLQDYIDVRSEQHLAWMYKGDDLKSKQFASTISNNHSAHHYFITIPIIVVNNWNNELWPTPRALTKYYLNNIRNHSSSRITRMEMLTKCNTFTTKACINFVSLYLYIVVKYGIIHLIIHVTFEGSTVIKKI